MRRSRDARRRANRQLTWALRHSKLIAPRKHEVPAPRAGFKFCPRCATRLVIKPISYDQNREIRACPACDFVSLNDPKVPC